MITPDATVLEPWVRQRRFAKIGVLLIALILLAAWLYFPALSIPSDRLVGWQLTGYGEPQSDPTTAQTIGVVRVFIASWPVEYPQGDDSWLATPAIVYTPWSVTITMHTTDAYANRPGKTHGWYDTGGWVDVRLGMPLGGRVLFDGSTLAPEPRLYH